MTHRDLHTDLAHERLEELSRRADARGLGAAVRAARRQRDVSLELVGGLRLVASSLHRRNAAQARAGA